MSSIQKGTISLLVAALLYGLFGVFSRVIQFKIPIFYQAWIRNIFVLLLFIIIVFITKSWKKVHKGDLKWFIARSVAGFISFIGIYWAFNYISFGTVYFISYASATIGGFLLGKVLCDEKINKVKMIALGLSVAGIYLVFKESVRLENPFFTLVAFIAGFGNAGWNVFSKKISGRYSNIQINSIDTLFAFILPFIFSLYLKETWVLPTFNITWLATALLGMLFLTTGFLVVYGFKHVEAQKGTLIMLLDVVLGVFFGYLFFKEIPSFISVIGGGLILFAIVLPNFSHPQGDLKSSV